MILERLVVKLGMDVDQASVGRARAGLAAVAAGAAKLAAGMVGAATATVGLTLQVAKQADELNKDARRMNLTAAELVGLRHAADLAGVSFGDLRTAVRSLQRNIPDAAQGVGEAAREIDKMGLSAADLVELPITEQIAAIADAMKDVDAGERGLIAQRIFGRSGTQILTLLEAGSDGIAEMAAEAEALGLTFDDATGRAAEDLNDQLTRLQGLTGGLVRGFGLALVPGLKNVIDAVLAWARANREVARVGLERIANTLTSAIEALMTPFGAFVAGVISLLAGGKILKLASQLPVLGRAFSMLGARGGPLALATLAIVAFGIALEDIVLSLQSEQNNTLLNNFAKNSADAAAQLDADRASWRRFYEQMQELDEALRSIGLALPGISVSLSDMLAAVLLEVTAEVTNLVEGLSSLIDIFNAVSAGDMQGIATAAGTYAQSVFGATTGGSREIERVQRLQIQRAQGTGSLLRPDSFAPFGAGFGGLPGAPSIMPTVNLTVPESLRAEDIAREAGRAVEGQVLDALENNEGAR